MSSLEVLIPAMVLRIAKWAAVRKDFATLKVDDTIRNWGACLVWVLGKQG